MLDVATFLERLKELQGEVSDAEFARRCDIKYTTMKNYLRGRSVPPLDVAEQIASKYEKSIDWLAGRDPASAAIPMQAQSQSAETGQRAPLDEWLLEELAKIASREHKHAGQSLPPAKIAREAGALYNELLGIVRNVGDRRAVEAILPLLAENLRARLRDAAANPGTGKRAAS